MKYKNIEDLKEALRKKCNESNIIFNEDDVTSCNQGKILECKCSICGDTRKLRIFDILKYNRKCANCIGTKNKTNEEKILDLKEKAKKLGYTILNDIVYTDHNHTEIRLKCNKCGYEWRTSPRCLNKNLHCRRCSGIENNFIDVSIKEKNILERCKDTPYQFLGWTDENSKKTHSKIDIKCTKHNIIWHPTYKDFVQELKGCALCASEVNVYEQRLLKSLNKKYNLNILYQYHNKKFLGKQSFDFYIPEYKIAIEVQGEEHFVPVRHSKYETDEDILKNHNAIKERDKRKYDIAKKNNINLLYFSYSKRKYIPKEYLDEIYLTENSLFEKIDLLLQETKRL